MNVKGRWSGREQRGKERSLGCERIELCNKHTHTTHEDSIMKPTKHCKRWKEKGRTCSKYTVHKYGIITMKLPYIY
jgi:hypothetical protein